MTANHQRDNVSGMWDEAARRQGQSRRSLLCQPAAPSPLAAGSDSESGRRHALIDPFSPSRSSPSLAFHTLVMSQNRAAWYKTRLAQFEVDDAPMWTAEKGEVLVKMIKQYPFILGTDVAGEVVEVGEGVSNVKKGDRVLGHCKSLASGEPKHSAFQRFAVVDALLVSPIPDSLPLDQATVLPLGLSTAASGLYPKRYLALPYPKADAPNPEGKGKVLFVYGGSSSVGACAIQLGVASGLQVITTCSPANFEFVKSLGAAEAFDYRTPKDELVTKVVAEVEKQGSEYAGAFDAISEHGSVETCAEVAIKAFGGKRQKFIAATLPPPKELPDGISSEWIFAIDIALKEDAAVARAVYHDFVTAALKAGSLQAKPDPLVVGKGLESVQKGLDRQKEGVSAKKVVVTAIQG
ncbi:NADPH quinone reductase [Rhodotorula diobovata]|uniref:NADPH quinone reductase n=1 Tax=Rhodotorula diobovata TaxID=5288 RepID=A0A5C5G425_9BASI|nr:NADPH quinone reductase [Rhodotorula diobovata]